MIIFIPIYIIRLFYFNSSFPVFPDLYIFFVWILIILFLWMVICGG